MDFLRSGINEVLDHVSEWLNATRPRLFFTLPYKGHITIPWSVVRIATPTPVD